MLGLYISRSHTTARVAVSIQFSSCGVPVRGAGALATATARWALSHLQLLKHLRRFRLCQWDVCDEAAGRIPCKVLHFGKRSGGEEGKSGREVEG